MIELLKYVFSGFWTFWGFCIILALIFNFVLQLWNSIWRHLNIRKHGWPPSHLDADGDFKKEDDDE